MKQPKTIANMQLQESVKENVNEIVDEKFNPNESECSAETDTPRNGGTLSHNWRPLDVIVVQSSRDTSNSSNNDEFSTRTTTSSNAAAAFTAAHCQTQHDDSDNVGRTIDRPAPLQFASPTFTLMPRNGVSAMWNLSPMSGASGSRDSRKRRAHSMSSPHSSDNEEEEDSNLAVFAKEDSSSPAGRAGDVGSDLLTMERLTLNSPAKQPLKPDLQSCRQLFRSQNSVRSGVSSFSVYVSSPAESIHRSVSGSLSGSASSIVASKTPCSSTKSSPRHVPLTILPPPPQVQQAAGPSPVRIQIPNGRPPFHFAHSKMPGRGETFSSPRSTSRSLLDPDMDVKRTPDTRNSSMEASDDIWTPRTDGAPSTKEGGATPKTPLPRITLTPRTPLSARCSQTSRLPMFPVSYIDNLSPKASDDEDVVGLMMDDLLEGFVGYVASSSQSLRSPDETFPTLTFFRGSSQSLALSDASAAGVTTPPTIAQTATPPVRLLESNLQRSNAFSGNNGGGALSSDPVDLGSKSVLTLPRRSDNFPSEVIGGVEGMDADTGSLSDTDDEDFVLACPLSLSIQQKLNLSPISTTRRVKQRQRCPNDVTIPSTGYGSFASMTSNQVSATSLFGMDIVHEESCCDVSGTPRGIPSFNGMAGAPSLLFRDGEQRYLCRSRDGDSSVSMARGKSDLSLGSLGLCLEERSCDATRDLITPPAFVERAISSPPLMMTVTDPFIPLIKSPPSFSSARAN